MSAAGELRVSLADLSALPEARHSLAEWLRELPVKESVAADLVCAAGELCANAVRAAESTAEMTARLEDRSVVVEVLDDGGGLDCDLPEEPPAPYAESGRGIYLVRQMVDVLWIRPRPDGPGTCATFARRLEG